MFATASAVHPEKVYWTSTHVTFLAPFSTANPNTLQVNTDSLVTTAGVVAKLVTQGDVGAQVVSDSVTLADQGIRHGYSVRLPNDGGQWAINYDQPYLDIQAIGTSPPEAATTLRSVVNRIRATLGAVQRAQRVDSWNLISTQLNPEVPPIRLSTGSRARAVLSTLLLGSGLTAAGVVVCAGVIRRRAALPATIQGAP